MFSLLIKQKIKEGEDGRHNHLKIQMIRCRDLHTGHTKTLKKKTKNSSIPDDRSSSELDYLILIIHSSPSHILEGRRRGEEEEEEDVWTLSLRGLETCERAGSG
jgi:hypothetical protein